MTSKRKQPVSTKKQPAPRPKPTTKLKQPAPVAKPTKSPRKRPITLITRGNTKLGPKLIWSWNIPALSTCPGHSEVCSSVCYALSGRYTFTAVRERYASNFEISKRDDFAEEMIAEIQRANAQVFRLHSSGDMYSVAYIRKWIAIGRACPETKFFVYTRSWRIAGMRPALEELASLPNFQVWYSIDSSTGLPPTKPPRVRYAYLLLSDAEEAGIPPECDLVFRNEEGRPAKKLGGVQVCVYENGIPLTNGKLTCDKCSICWKDPRGRASA